MLITDTDGQTLEGIETGETGGVIVGWSQQNSWVALLIKVPVKTTQHWIAKPRERDVVVALTPA